MQELALSRTAWWARALKAAAVIAALIYGPGVYYVLGWDPTAILMDPLGIAYLAGPWPMLAVFCCWIGWVLWDENARSQAGSAGQTLNLGALRRAWWGTPLVLTGSLMLVFYAVVALFLRFTPWEILRWPGAVMIMVGPWPAYVAGGLGVLGLLWGWMRSASAKETVAAAYQVAFLPDDDPITRRVHDLATKMGLPKPAVGVMDCANAFAVGSSVKRSAVVIGRPLIKKLTPEELDAIIGHELGHIATRDAHRLQVAEGYQECLGGVVTLIAQMLVAAVAKTREGANLGYMLGKLGRVTVFIAGELLVLRLSRSREFYADAIGAAVTSPDIMERALVKLHGMDQDMVEVRFGYLMVRPLAAGSVFATHPTLERRIAALRGGRYVRKVVLGSPGRSLHVVAAVRRANMVVRTAVVICMLVAPRWTRVWAHPITGRMAFGASVVGCVAAGFFGTLQWMGPTENDLPVIGSMLIMPGTEKPKPEEPCREAAEMCRAKRLASIDTWTDVQLMRFALSGLVIPPFTQSWKVHNAYRTLVSDHVIDYRFETKERCTLEMTTRTEDNHKPPMARKDVRTAVRKIDFRQIKDYRVTIGDEVEEGLLFAFGAVMSRQKNLPKPQQVIQVMIGGQCVISERDKSGTYAKCEDRSAEHIFHQVFDKRLKPGDLQRAFHELKRRGC